MARTVHGVRVSDDLVRELAAIWYNCEGPRGLEGAGYVLEDVRKDVGRTVEVLRPLILAGSGVTEARGDVVCLSVPGRVLAKARGVAAAWRVDEDPDDPEVLAGVLDEVLDLALARRPPVGDGGER